MKFMVVTGESEGPKEDENVYQILDPDDRQPGWRNRTNISLYDVESGTLRQLSFGSREVYPMDISDEKAHGYGLKIVRKTLGEHEGMLDVGVKDGWFVASFMLPVEKVASV